MVPLGRPEDLSDAELNEAISREMMRCKWEPWSTCPRRSVQLEERIGFEGMALLYSSYLVESVGLTGALLDVFKVRRASPRIVAECALSAWRVGGGG